MTPVGIDQINLGTCDGFTCGNTSIETRYRDQAGLTYDAVSGRILRKGDNGFGLTKLDVIEPVSGALESSTGVDPMTIGGLAVRKVPEPGAVAGLVSGVVCLLALDKRRRRQLG